MATCARGVAAAPLRARRPTKTKRLQPTRTAALLFYELRYHRVAVRAAEPRAVGGHDCGRNL